LPNIEVKKEIPFEKENAIVKKLIKSNTIDVINKAGRAAQMDSDQNKYIIEECFKFPKNNFCPFIRITRSTSINNENKPFLPDDNKSRKRNTLCPHTNSKKPRISNPIKI